VRWGAFTIFFDIVEKKRDDMLALIGLRQREQ
jgi:hypothetical protein